VIEDMAERGVKVKRAWLSRIENGARFSDELLAALQDYYGSVPPPYESVEETAGDVSLTAALSELAAELRANREERALLTAKLVELEALVTRLTERGFGAATEPAPHPQTTGSGR
jgi:hypothetical protein